MDFKIGDEIEETSEDGGKSHSNLIPIIIIVVISLVCGLTVFLITNAIFGKKEPPKEDPIVETPLNLSDENVEILYDYVTYGTTGERNDKFIKEPKVTLDSFSNQEKYYYALQFAQVEDFEPTGKIDETSQRKIYNISDVKIRNYMQRFFGGSVSYNNNVTLTYPFSFSINGQNVGIMTPNTTNGGLDTIFDGQELPKESAELVKPFYADLVAAYKEADGTYRLEEKIIYTRAEKKEDGYTIYLYRDYGQTQLIETKLNQTEEMLKTNPIDIKNYKEKGATIKYHFGLFNNMLYFESSTIDTTNAVQVEK